MSDDPFDDIINDHDFWVIEPPLEILYAIMATEDANVGLSEGYD
jgi:hypothetical protein